MKYVNKFIADILKRPSFYFFVVLIVFTFDRHSRYEFSHDKDNGPFYSDVLEYYNFLPEYFLDHKPFEALNIKTNRRTVGMAIMYSPAFFVGHLIAEYTGEAKTGYTWPYQWAVRWGSIIYVVLGLAFCRKNLLRFFNEPVVAIALTCIFFATNLFYYTYGNGEFPHGYLFFLYSAFIFCTFNWLNDKPRFLTLLCFLAGMIVLIRPSGILIFLFPLLYNIRSLHDFNNRWKYLVRKPVILLISFIVFMSPLIFQMLVWKKFHGEYVYYTYGEERFFFKDPQIVNFLFSYRKGWLVYSPIMIFSLIGMIFMWRNLKTMFLFIWVYVALTIYVLSSWWDWSYGGGFGCRPLIESYAFLIFPLAAFISYIWTLNLKYKTLRYASRLMIISVFYCLIEFNLFQVWQLKYGRIHWAGMNKETYWYVFLNDQISDKDLRYLETKWKEPDIEAMLNGKRDQ